MRIGTQNSLSNVFGASRNLGETSKAIARALERLSSGSRVNGPSDGAADYRASLSLDSQIRGIHQINLGLNRALGMVQVADSAIATQLDMLQRMREIAVEGSSGSLDTTSRKTLNSELQSLLEEFDRITKSTEFDGQKLLDGAFGNSSLLLDQSGGSLTLEMSDHNLTEVFRKLTGTGSFTALNSFNGGDLIGSVEMADINNDGNLDIASVSPTDETVTIFLGNGDGSFAAGSTFYGGDDPRDIHFADLDGDGLQDLAVASRTDGTLGIFYGNGDGSFQSITTYDSGTNPYDVVSGDINGDGLLDLISSGSGATGLNIFTNNGDGTFTEETPLAAGNSPQGVAMADVNNDGYLDLLASAATDNVVAVLIGNGDGTFQAQMTFDGGDGGSLTHAIDVGDFNGDGVVDIATASGGDDAINILIGNGDGTFQALTSVGGINDPRDIVVADFNADGNMDIAAPSLGDDGLAILFGNGDGTFQPLTTYLTGNGVVTVDAGDFNNDGVVDVVTGGSFDDSVWLHLSGTKEVAAVSDLNVSDEESASKLIDILDETIARLSENRGDLGVLYNRTEATQVANLTQAESLTSAKSLIEDTDFALETAELVKQQIMQQAQVAVQAQANVQLQVVLGLLQF